MTLQNAVIHVRALSDVLYLKNGRLLFKRTFPLKALVRDGVSPQGVKVVSKSTLCLKSAKQL